MTLALVKDLERIAVINVEIKPFHKITESGVAQQAFVEIKQSFKDAEGYIQHFVHRSATYEGAYAAALKTYNTLKGE